MDFFQCILQIMRQSDYVRKIDNGSKLLSKGVLDGGSIPPTSTIYGGDRLRQDE